MDYVAIDFEASCLPRHGRSLPIEVGIAGRFGARSWLIRPATGWQGWSWTDEAFGLHGISLEQLFDEGIAPTTVTRELVEMLAGKHVVADSMIDSYWWDTLAAATPRRPPSPIEHASSVLDEWGASSTLIAAACRSADRICPVRHRAAEDARWLWTVLSNVRGELEAAADTPWRERAGRPVIRNPSLVF